MFKQLRLTVLAILGLASFTKAEDGKEILTEDQVTLLKAQLGDEFAGDFVQFLDREGKGEQLSSEEQSQLAAKLTSHIQALAQSNANLAAKAKGLENQIQGFQTNIQTLTEKVNKLSNSSEDDVRNGSGKRSTTVWTPNGKDTHLFGENHSFMAIDDAHPYNQRAYAAMCLRQGIIYPVRSASSTDYASIKADLGEFYRVRYTEKIQSFVSEMPSLSKIFKTQSNLQDQAVIPNIFSTEISQAHNPSSDFIKIVKGSFKFEAEIIRMFDVKVVHMFEDMKEVEKTWIGWVNREGSQSIKWSLLEYLQIEISKRTHNEREIRRVKGVFKTPVKDQPGNFINASDGLLKRIKVWISEFKIKTFVVGHPVAGSMVNYIRDLASRIPEHIRMTGVIECYMSTDMFTTYLQNYELLYGQNMDYKGGIYYVKDYDQVKIVPIPGMAPSNRVIFTFKDNFFIAEDKPGEYFDYNFEQEDWKLKMWSDSKESIWAQAVGRKYASAAEMPDNYENQLIWCNDVDEPIDLFIEMAADDTTPSAINHTSLVSVANTQATAITDILDVAVGQTVRLKCGNATNAPTIAASGKFSLLTAAWNPSVGDIITLQKRSDGKFIELARHTAVSQAIVIAADDTSPDVSDGDTFVTSANTQATAITTLDNSEAGIVYTIHGGSATNATTIANSGNFVLTAAITLTVGTWIKLVKSSVNGKFYEIQRS